MLDEIQQNLKIVSDQKIISFNDNHIFDMIGLSETTDDEQKEFLPEDLYEYLARQEYIERGEDQKNASPQSLHMSSCSSFSEEEDGLKNEIYY